QLNWPNVGSVSPTTILHALNRACSPDSTSTTSNSRSLPMYFAEIRIYRPDKHYWTVGLFTSAESFSSAVIIFEAWCHGVELGLGVKPHIEEVALSKPRGRKYRALADMPALRKELEEFLRGE